MKKIFEAKTVQTANIKTLFEVLKKILVEVNLIVTNKGIKVVSINDSNISLIHLKLYADNFEYYMCEAEEQNPIVLGIHTESIFKIMKTIKHDETISLYVLENENILYIQKENNDRNNITTFKLPLHQITFQNIVIDDIEYDTIINMDSSEFHKICKDYNQLGSRYLEIKNIDNQLILNSEADICKTETVYGISESTSFDVKNQNYIIQGKYNLEYLLLFSKTSHLSNIVEIYLKNDCPIILNYKIGTLGDIKFMISPVEI